MAIWHIFTQGIIKNMKWKSQSNELERELYPSVVFKCKPGIFAQGEITTDSKLTNILLPEYQKHDSLRFTTVKANFPSKWS